jgi:hypothetical protein
MISYRSSPSAFAILSVAKDLRYARNDNILCGGFGKLAAAKCRGQFLRDITPVKVQISVEAGLRLAHRHDGAAGLGNGQGFIIIDGT